MQILLENSLSLYLSIDLPLVALIIQVRSATWHAPRTFLLTRRRNQKTSSKGTKIHENRTPSAFKIHSKSSLKAILLQRKPSKNLNLFENLSFFNDFWLPKRKQNWRKNAENVMFKNNALLNRFLLEFSSLWLPKMERKLNVFRIFIEKANFVKTIVLP